MTFVVVACVGEVSTTGGPTPVLVEDTEDNELVLAKSLYSVVEPMVLIIMLGVAGAVATTSLVDVITVSCDPISTVTGLRGEPPVL